MSNKPPLVKYRQNRKPELADMKHIIIHAIALPMTNDLDENKQKRGQQRSSFVSVWKPLLSEDYLDVVSTLMR